MCEESPPLPAYHHDLLVCHTPSCHGSLAQRCFDAMPASLALGQRLKALLHIRRETRNRARKKRPTVQALKYPSADAVTLYICQVSRQLIENKNDLLKLIKPKWPPQPCFQSHM